MEYLIELSYLKAVAYNATCVNRGHSALLQEVKGQLLEDVKLVRHLCSNVLRADDFLRQNTKQIIFLNKRNAKRERKRVWRKNWNANSNGYINPILSSIYRQILLTLVNFKITQVYTLQMGQVNEYCMRGL